MCEQYHDRLRIHWGVAKVVGYLIVIPVLTVNTVYLHFSLHLKSCITQVKCILLSMHVASIVST